MIKDIINSKIAESLRSHDEIRLSTLRMLSSALNYEFINKQHELSEEEEVVVVRREVKKRTDAIDAYKKVLEKDPAHVQEKIDKEEAEIRILRDFLPPEMGQDELSKIIDEAISQSGASTIKDMGKVIGLVKEKVKGAADGAKIAEIVKSRLQ